MEPRQVREKDDKAQDIQTKELNKIEMSGSELEVFCTLRVDDVVN